MFLKQWLAASAASVSKVYYHDFNRNQSHHIFPLIRKLKHLTVGAAWAFIIDLTVDLRPCKMNVFSQRIADISVGKIKVPVAPERTSRETNITVKGVSGSMSGALAKSPTAVKPESALAVQAADPEPGDSPAVAPAVTSALSAKITKDGDNCGTQGRPAEYTCFGSSHATKHFDYHHTRKRVKIAQLGGDSAVHQGTFETTVKGALLLRSFE